MVTSSLVAAASLSVLTTAAIILILFSETAKFFGLEEVRFSEFITGTQWTPLLGAERHFGIWPLIIGTLKIAAVSAMVSIPFGIITAIYLSEYAPERLRGFLKPILEILAGIPTVVYGFFALTVITPGFRSVFSWFTGQFFREVPVVVDGEVVNQTHEPLFSWVPAIFGDSPSPVLGVYNALAAGIAVGIMCLPIVTSLSEDALRAVPRSLREGAYAVGGTKFDVSVKVVLPGALSGVMAASLLAVARAVGETMIVALAAGGIATMSLNPMTETQTMTAYMVQIFLGDASNFGPEYLSSYAVGATLFLMTLVLTLIGARVLGRFREVYE